ncbi:MAG: alanine--tRNA ligase [bacterium]
MARTDMTAAEIRQSFQDFYRSKRHEIVPSSPVVLQADPTLLFVNAGMNQFKEIFLGARASQYGRVANSQKCIRVSGKHNDLEEVGHDTYHHTFFEMLGNWSFGDYYKRESIAWGWELLTQVWGLPKNRLWVTVYKDDDEALAIWKEVTDVDPSHILKFGDKDNFWEMGETGPCGPCSEIHYDRTPDGCTPDMINAGKQEVIEIWNHVFIQYNRRSDGSLEELPAKHVDTGMGFERVASVIQGKTSNYDTDVFQPMIQAMVKASGHPYEGQSAIAMRVIADHLRTLAFAIGDGVLPSNDGRGYVLRRLLRRAVRYGRKIGFTKPFMTTLLPTLESTMGLAYPELGQHRQEIARAILAEEESFSTTLDRGLALFEDVAAAAARSPDKVFPGDEAFKLYDTYGFPLDLTVVMAREKGMAVDEKRFAVLMDEQRRRAREARRAAAADGDADLVSDLVARGVKTVFTGYAGMEGPAGVVELLRKGAEGASAIIDRLDEGMEGAILLTESPFYAEKGGQLGDHGSILGPDGDFEVTDTRQPTEGVVLHVGKMKRGTLARGARVTAKVNDARRAAVARHHTATHLLQHALREIVSPNIKQAGSMVAPDRLRFDFAYYQALTPDQIAAVERRVNDMVVSNDPVTTIEMALKDVQGSGIIAIFDEKYGDTVRVVNVGGYSRELCGGTHVAATGTIGLFRILSECSIASGVRRIEAVAGVPAYEAMVQDRVMLEGLAKRFSVSSSEVPDRVEALSGQVKALEKQLKDQELAVALQKVEGLLGLACEVKGVKLIAASVGELTAEALKSLAEAVMAKAAPAVVVLGAASAGKAQFIAAVSPEWVKKGVHAGKLIKDVAKVAGGGGGGQPGLANAGGKDPGKLDEAVQKSKELVGGMVKEG